MAFLRRTSIANSLPIDLYPPAKDVQIPLEWLFGDDIYLRINNINAIKKAFKAYKTFLSQKGHLIGNSTFLTKIQKTGRDFQKFPQTVQGVQKQIYKTEIQPSKELANFRIIFTQIST